MEQQDYHNPPTRRGFLEGIIALFSAVAGLAMAVPGLMYLWPATRAGGSQKVEVDGAAQLSPGQSTIVQVGSQVVIVVRGTTGFKAFSAACTHLGCLVEWDPSRKQFLCPCHAAVFDDNGQVVSGPPPGPLPALKVKELGKKVYVSVA
ncbi:MAG: ubiquinol-cytochrome c reductase iron-sulfur subunit [Phycisphaerae bacterium]